ncbi:hypothetical protein AK812_SmicGene23949 [Symbiodinium microadriaticum]|uniref:Uncharacterized protein n=1 Tax=Symbiodinium microadriaticum TaxID=2951 RepID=A0A1Q9DFW7_SYMMI|nr:hypothetical protein AK812_SmicGene23949 [Symbiodinium microadriaticum]
MVSLSLKDLRSRRKMENGSVAAFDEVFRFSGCTSSELSEAEACVNSGITNGVRVLKNRSGEETKRVFVVVVVVVAVVAAVVAVVVVVMVGHRRRPPRKLDLDVMQLELSPLKPPARDDLPNFEAVPSLRYVEML